MTRSIQDVSQGVEELVEQAENISKIGENTYHEIEKTTSRINQGNELVTTVVNKMDHLQESISKIGKISDKIMKITDQTNLLALNAAIEAARAGEHGKGFTVVAEEIVSLADESKEAIQEVQNIVQEVKKSALETVEVMVAQEEEDNIVSIFNDINRLSKQVLYKMKQVREAAENQVASTEEVSASSQQISASSQEVTAQPEDTLTLVRKMDDIINDVINANKDLIKRTAK